MSGQGSPSEVSTVPRKVRADGERTRKAILEAAVDLASVEGLSALTIGRLARHVGMSKSGLFAHFGSKEELQLAAVEEPALQLLPVGGPEPHLLKRDARSLRHAPLVGLSSVQIAPHQSARGRQGAGPTQKRAHLADRSF
ncbi:MAG: helix-turn-helix transcriptional regulator [Proteobacteria bacterium]|nr:helix-turn-helix transcriptional regulator [Pseudomonadota bacterium]